MEKRKRRILLIEDDFDLGENVKEILDEEYDVEVKIDGKEGIVSVHKWKPDLILCDIAMPKMDGFDVLKKIREDEETKKLPFIFLTAKVNKDDIRKGMMLGADDYIFKPFETEDLKNSINLRFERIDNTNKDRRYSYEDQVVIESGNKIQVCDVKSIKYLKAETPYVRFKLENGKSNLKRGTLNDWEENLPDDIFVRVHRSAIVNSKYIDRIERRSKTSYVLFLIDEEEPIDVSRRYSSKLKSVFKH